MERYRKKKLWEYAKGYLFKHVSYRLRVSVVLVLFAIIPFSVYSVIYLQGERTKWETNALKDYSHMLAVGSEQFDRAIQEMELKILYISNSSNIRATIAKVNKLDLVGGLEFISVLRETVASITADNESLAVRWYPFMSTRDYGGYCYTLSRFEEEFKEENGLFEQIMDLGNGEVLVAVRNLSRESNDRGSTKERVCVYAKMTNINGSDCLLEMSMPADQLIDLDNINLPSGSVLGVYLTLEHGSSTLLISGEEAVGEEIKESENQSVTAEEMAEGILAQYHETGDCPGYYPIVSPIDNLAGSKVTCLLPREYVVSQVWGHAAGYLVIIILFIVAIMVCSYMASALLTLRITRSIEKMNNELDTILIEPTITVIEDSDFLGIEKRIRQLIQSTQEYCTRLEQAEAENNRLELELLQMRFNPHFLYNTLTSIAYQVEEQTIRDSIESLIHYYRIVLSKGHLVIQIEEEIAMIREYLELQIFAYRLENIRYVFEVDENVKAFMIVKHLLQPIVENALEHGLRTRDEEGMIWIRAKLTGKDIVFEIEDNGAGMTPEQIARVLSEPARGSVGGGYGVYNVQQRIETYYGKGYGVVFHSKSGEGTKVTLRIPQKDEVL